MVWRGRTTNGGTGGVYALGLFAESVTESSEQSP